MNDKGNTVKVWLDKTSVPIVYTEVRSTYEKGSFYCILVGDVVHKYPIVNIFRVEETY